MVAKSRKGAIIGLDGVPYGMLDDLSDRGVMSNFRDLKRDGAFVPMRSAIPANSAVSWISIITGENPGEHGVYGFTDLMKGSYVSSYHSSLNLRAPPFWRMDDSTYLVINLPAAYPAQEMNGVLISGFVSPNIDRAVYPPSYAGKLKEHGYMVDVDASKAQKSKLLFFKELNEALDRRMDTLRLLIAETDWDVLMFVITGTDRLEHYLWDAYSDRDHEWHQELLDFYGKVDEAIGYIASVIGDDTPLMMLSDHGMEGIEAGVNVNTHLTQHGYLDLEDNPRKSYNGIKTGTKAFALESARIYLNKVGKYPRGSVTHDSEPQLLEELTDLFQRLEKNGRKVIRKVHRRDELYRGKELANAPDLVLVPESGFNLKMGLHKEKLFERGFLTGKHTEEDAFLYVRGWEDDSSFPRDPTVEDALSIFQKISGGR